MWKYNVNIPCIKIMPGDNVVIGGYAYGISSAYIPDRPITRQDRCSNPLHMMIELYGENGLHHSFIIDKMCTGCPHLRS